MIAETTVQAPGASLASHPLLRPASLNLFRLAAVITLIGGGIPAPNRITHAADAVPAEQPAALPRLAPSFRIETELFEGTQTKPQSQHLLLFDGGVVYDLPMGTGTTITVFDPARSRVMLLHKIQRVRTSISTDALIQVSAQARSAAMTAGSARSLGLDARVTKADVPDTYTIEFDGTKYAATTQPALVDGVASEYAAFTVWACRLNIARHVGPPPFARMTLADFLAAENALPRQIKLDVRRGLKTRTYRSENLYVGRLSDLDRKRISEVGDMLASFSEVEFSAFPAD